MAAALAAFNNYLTTLGVNNTNVREALNNQGLQGADNFEGLTDDVTNLSDVRRLSRGSSMDLMVDTSSIFYRESKFGN